MASKQIAKMTPDELVKRWQTHIGWIADEANGIAIDRYRFGYIERWLFKRQQRRVVNRTLQAFGWISHLFMMHGLMYVRRELDDQNGVINLQQLFREIEARPDALPGLGLSEIVADRETLRERCAGPHAFAQQQVAHRAPMDDPFTSLAGLDEALDAIFFFVKKLHWLLIGTNLRFKHLKPDPRWLQGFTVPWYRPRGKMREQIKRIERLASR